MKHTHSIIHYSMIILAAAAMSGCMEEAPHTEGCGQELNSGFITRNLKNYKDGLVTDYDYQPYCKNADDVCISNPHELETGIPKFCSPCSEYGQLKCGEDNECIDVLSNRNHCGACNNVCSICLNGSCILHEVAPEKTNLIPLESTTIAFKFTKTYPVDIEDVKLLVTSDNENCITVKTPSVTASEKEAIISVTATDKNIDGCTGSIIIKNADAPEDSLATVKLTVAGMLDQNNNHMLDTYETAAKQGEACHYYSDCDSTQGAGDGFCDSFIGNKCSTRCTADKECSEGFICRSDGRCAAKTFETWWDIDRNKTITIKTSEAENCDFTIDWGDGQTDKISACNCECGTVIPCEAVNAADCANDPSTCLITSCQDGNLTHQYTTSDEVVAIKISGTYDGWSSTSNYQVISFGPVGLAPAAFKNSFVTINSNTIDIPDATKLTNCAEMFYNNRNDTDHPLLIGHWDTSNVTDMNSMFYKAANFNQDLSLWDTSKVTDMSNMFNEARSFDSNISTWNTSKVTDMNHMFYKSSSFNQKIGNWDTANVTDMSYMFSGAPLFNQDIRNWNTAKVTNMSGMFQYAEAYNQDCSKWDTSSVTDMSRMFDGAYSFDGYNLNNWDTSNVTDMSFMFNKAINFRKDIKSWDTSKVTNMSSMFCNAISFNSPLAYTKDETTGKESWNTSNVTDMNHMFNNAITFNNSLSGWDTSNVKNMGGMFEAASQFNSDIGNWHTENVEEISNMFYGALSFDQDLSDWDLTSLKNDTEFNIFSKSSLSQENYCSMISNNDVWKVLHDASLLGVIYICNNN